MIHEVRVHNVCVEWTYSAKEAETAFSKTRQSAQLIHRVGDKTTLVKETRTRTATLGDQLRAKGY